MRSWLLLLRIAYIKYSYECHCCCRRLLLPKISLSFSSVRRTPSAVAVARSLCVKIIFRWVVENKLSWNGEKVTIFVGVGMRFAIDVRMRMMKFWIRNLHLMPRHLTSSVAYAWCAQFSADNRMCRRLRDRNFRRNERFLRNGTRVSRMAYGLDLIEYRKLYKRNARIEIMKSQKP